TGDPLNRTTCYDEIAEGYDRRYRHFDYREIEEALTAFLDGGPASDVPRVAKSVLEVGCGTGHWLAFLSGRRCRAVGLDLSHQMIARAKGSGAGLVRGRAETLPFADESFDRVICVHALHHFQDREYFFGEARRVLKTGGGFINIGLDPHADRDTWWI